MDPNYLKALMHGEISFKKGPRKKEKESKLEEEVDKEIDAFAESYSFEEDPAHTSLLSAKEKRDRLKLEIKEKMRLLESSQTIGTAIDLLCSEARRYLSKEASEQLLSELSYSAEYMEDIGIEEVLNETLQELTQISNSSLKAIADIAAAKFEEARYDDCLALYSLLCALNPQYPELWFRTGIMAKKMNKTEQASRAFAAALELDPNNIGARLFAAECFIQRNLLDEAKAELATAKELSKTIDIDQMWLNLIPAIEELMG